MLVQSEVYKTKAVKVCNLTLFFVLSLLISACSPLLQPPPAPTPLPAHQTNAADHTPVILRVEERTESVNGQVVIHKDIYFKDVAGDATTVVNKLISTDPAGIPAALSDDNITASVNEQKREGLVTSTAGPSFALNPFSITIEERILDKAGNLSEPVLVTFSFPVNPPNSRPFLMSGLLIGSVLLLGFWLWSRRHASSSTMAFQSTLLLFCSWFPMAFIASILHEAGHAMSTIIQRRAIFAFYVHPFSFSGFVASDHNWNYVWNGALPFIVAILVPFVIFILLWKRRSIVSLPFVMLFPQAAINQGLQILSLDHDTRIIMQTTGLPGSLFIGLGILLVIPGIFFFISLFPLFGLTSEDRKSLLVVPTALFMVGAFGRLVAHFCVPGSPADIQFLRGAFIIISSNKTFILFPLTGLILATIYITLYRRLYPKLPTWLRTETVSLTWKDLRLPAVLAAICVFLGVMIIT